MGGVRQDALLQPPTFGPAISRISQRGLGSRWYMHVRCGDTTAAAAPRGRPTDRRHSARSLEINTYRRPDLTAIDRTSIIAAEPSAVPPPTPNTEQIDDSSIGHPYPARPLRIFSFNGKLKLYTDATLCKTFAH